MITATTETKDTVNNLIEICLDGEHGFDAAAKAVTHSDLKSELSKYSTQRKQFALELQRLLGSLGEEPKISGSMGAALHRGWMNMKQAVTGDNRHAVLAECERGEDAAVKAYRQAMQEPLAVEVAATIESQYHEVLRVHDRIRSLRDSSKGQ